MDAKSPQLRPQALSSRLLLEAPVLPYAGAVVGATWLGLHGRLISWHAGQLWLLTAAALAALLCPRLRPAACGLLLAILGFAAGSTGRAPDLSALRPDVPVVLEGRVASHPRGVAGEGWLWLRVTSADWRGRQVTGGFDVLVGLPEGTQTEPSVPPAWGQRVRVKGFLKRSPVPANGGVSRPGPWRLDLPTWRFWQVEAPAAGWQRAATFARARVEVRLARDAAGGPPSLGSELRRALVTGSPDHLPEGVRRALRATGLSHLLAVSGLHVGLVAGWLWLICMPFGRRTRLLVALLGIGVYLLLVGPKASAVRAAGMGAIVALALCCRRPPQALNAAALWAAVVALWQPQWLDDLGFRLSVAATVGILALAPPLGATLASLAARCGLRGRVARLGCQGLAVSLVAQVATLPLLTPWTCLVHPAAPLLNLLAIPWLTAFLGLSFLSLPMPRLDDLLVPLLDALAWPMDRLAQAPPSALTTLPVSWSLAGCLLLAVSFAVWNLWPQAALRAATLAGLLLLQGGPAVPEMGHGGLEFVRLDVGQGDALLLRDGSSAVLVDGGGWRRGDIAARVLLPALAQLGVHRLDAVALSHPDHDHCRGLVDLSSYLPVAEVWASPGWRDACATELLARRGARWRPLWRGDRVEVGRWQVEVLWPLAGLRRGDANDRSLVLRASGGRHRVLLAADIEAATERRLLELAGADPTAGGLRATLLGVAHHGSKTSTSRAFLAAVAPRLATVGVGARNSYGHPHPTVLERLEAASVRLHRSDSMGRLRLRLSGDARLEGDAAASDLQ